MNKAYMICAVLWVMSGALAMENPQVSSADMLAKQLYNYAEKGDAQRVSELLDLGADPTSKWGKDQNTPLMIAAMRDHLPVVKALLRVMTPEMLNWTNAEGVPALHQAAYYGNHKIVSELIGAGADKDYQIDMSKLPKDGFNTPPYPTALMIAIKNWKDKTAQVLLNEGANPNIEGPNGMTALLIAPEEGMEPKVMRLLLEKGANVKKKNAWGQTALYGLVTGQECGSTCENIEALVQSGGQVNELFEGANNVLQLAFIKAAESDAQAKKERNNCAPLYWPSNYLVKTLIQCGINVRHRNSDGKTALDLVRPYENEFLNKYIIPLLEEAEKEQQKP
jgi:hypothetical protein